MLKQIKNVWLFSKNRFINTLLWVSLAAVITGLLVFLIVKVFGANDPDMTYIHMMSLMAYIVLWAAILLTGMTDFGKCFDMMVGMGRTRKEFFLSYGVLNFGTYLIYAAEILLIAWLETVIEKVCYAGIPCEMNLTFFFFDVRTIVLTILMGFVINMLLGALYVKFRQKIFMLVWVLFMGFGMMAQMISKAIDAQNPWLMAIGDFFVALFTSPAVILILGAVAVTVLLVAVSYLLVRKREISIW